MTDTPPHAPLLYRANSPGATDRLAQKIAPLARPGDVITLEGGLGAGKSHFARAFIQCLCGQDTHVPSPTFALVQPYDAPNLTLYHFDLYRLESPQELEELGFWDALDEGASLIEWPQKGGDAVPLTGLAITLAPGEDGEQRLITLVPGSDWHDRASALKDAVHD